MKRTYNIWTKQSLSTIMILLMMVLGGSVNAWGQEEEEKLLYSTDFTNWKSVDRQKATDEVVTLKTNFSNESFTFTFNGVGVYPSGTNSKFPETGFMETAKYTSEYSSAEPSAVTSPLASITKITLHQAATGGNRGIKVSVKGDGDADWVAVHNTSIVTSSGEDLTIEVNRKNCQIKLENFALNQNAYVTDLAIYGMVKPAAKVNISYYNTDGSLIGTETVEGNTALKYKYGASDVTVGSGEVFRGWFNGTDNLATKVTEGTTLIADMSLYAKATPKEEATFGSEYTYDMTRNYWYAEDHDLIDITGGAYQDNQHGWAIDNGGTIKLQVASQAKIDFALCTNNNDEIIVTDANGNQLGTIDSKAATDGEIHSFLYDGTPTTLTFSFSSTTYIHSIKQYNYKPVYIEFKFPLNGKIEGDRPETIQAESNGKATLPTNGLFYRDGWTFQGWTDGTNVYQPGENTFYENVTLYPKMTENTLKLTDTNSPVTVVWPFDHTKAPAINLSSDKTAMGKNMGYTQAGTLEGSPYDVRLWMDTETNGGKITNQDTNVNSYPGEGGQFSNGTKFTLPAVYGMTLTIHASTKSTTDIETSFGEGSNTKLTVSDANGFTVADEDIKVIDNKTLQFTYKGDATEITLDVVQACDKASKGYGFYKDITATYPVLPYVVAINAISNPDASNFPNEIADNAGMSTVESTTERHPNTGSRYRVGDKVSIVAIPDYGYTVKGFRIKGSDSWLATFDGTEENSSTNKSVDYTVTDGITTIEAVFERKTLHKVTIQASDANLGTVSLSPVYENFYNEIREAGTDGNKGKLLRIESWFTEGTEITATAEAASGYVVNYWSEADGTTHLTDANTYTYTTTAEDKTFVVYIKSGETGTVIFDISNAHVNGQTAAYKNAESIQPDKLSNVSYFVVPTNYTFFKNVDDNDKATENGYTLRYWKDANGNRYELGSTYSFKTKETLTLTPVFEYNPATQLNRTNEPIIRYDFGRNVHEYNDPTSGLTKKVCAQAVNIGNNQKPFWTTDVYVEVLENGNTIKQYRDAALWCDTGDKGYIRNTDLDNWCAFGQGTTFWFASAAGTKISIMTYSKITTTTIDGVVPTLDEQRTAEERKKQGSEHIYVYSYTTQNPDSRAAIIIGDDYSYYQWIELATPKANMVNLHISIDNEEHGTIDNVKSLSTFGSTELEDGGYAFRMGDRIQIAFERLFGYEFDKLVDINKTDTDGNPFTLFKMNNDGTVSMVDENYVMHTISKNANGTWGTADGDDKTIFTLKATEPKQEEAADGKRTTYELEYDITNHRTLQLVFKEKATHYITYGPGNFAEGTAPVAQWVEAGDLFTIPQNTTLYYEGNTLDHWIVLNDDGTTGDTYSIGQEYAAPAKDLRLSPVFEPNEFNILDLSQESTATWHFTKKDGAPNINYEKTAGILVTQLHDGDKKIDLKIDLDGRNGKFNNESNVSRIQINGGSIITFPSTDKCVVKLTASSGVPEQVTVGGKKNGDTDFIYDSKNKSIEVTCDGGSATQEANFTTNGAVYAVDFMVTYKPQDQTTKASIESLTCDGVTLDAATIKSQIADKGYVSFTVSPWKTNEVIPDVTGTATNGGTVTVTKGTVLTPEAVATVHTSGGVTVETYSIKFEFNTPDDYPVFQKMVVNGKTYTNTSNEIYDVPRSGIIEVDFNRTMKETNVVIDNPRIEATASAGKTLTFKYWDLPAGGTIPLVIKPNEGAFAGLMTDIYGKACQQTLTLILHVVADTEYYHHHNFDFIVGEDGTMDEAIEAANNNTKTDGHRYYIFVPDGEYQLTGNDPLTSYTSTSDGKWPTDGNGKEHPEIANLLPYNNGRTQISKSNVSLIGQSKEGVVIWNSPFVEGISYTSTLHIGKQVKDFYAQDLSLENRFNYWGSGSAGRAVAFWDQGNRSIMKNVALISYQDTYYSNNANDDYRGYFENCDIYGVVDFLCGDGDIWLEKCNLLLRDRTGNNIAAPSQGTNHQWGYVFNNCTIKPESDNPQQLKGNDWTLARPWNGSPACTYLNTKMATQPRPAGWGRMNTGEVLRLHEYRTMDENGILLSLGTRTLASCMPAAGSDDCVLSAASAAKYTIRNAMGGTDAFEPNELCKQIDAASSITANSSDDEDDSYDRLTGTENHVIWNDNLELNDDELQWDADNRALCYFLFKLNDNGKWIYQTNTIEASVNLTPYGSGYYCVRAANQRGGLGAATRSIRFTVTDPYELNLKQLGDLTDEEGNPCGWSTICLPFNAKVPSELTVYAATAHNKTTADDKVSDFTLTLTPVNVIDSEKGYVVYGPAGKHYFNLTSRSCDKETILTGNATETAISTANKSGYVLSNKTWGLGFYKFSGSTYSPYKAWLPQEMVTDEVQQALAAGARAIRLTVEDNTTKLNLPHAEYNDDTEALYNLSGQKVNSAKESGIYITRKKGKFIKK